MEGLNVVLRVCVIAVLVMALVALFRWLEAFSYEAYVPRYIEVPVFHEKVRVIRQVSSTTAEEAK